MPITEPMMITAPISVDGNITHPYPTGRYIGNPSPSVMAQAGVALTAGMFVTVRHYTSGARFRAFPAISAPHSPAVGYVTVDVASGGNALVHLGGINDKQTIANPTSQGGPVPVWLANSNGTATLTPPAEVVGYIAQRIGWLIGVNQILFEPEEPIALQNAIAGKVIPVVYSSSLGMLREITPTDVLPSNVGGGAPGGATTQIQFNDGGAFAGDAGLVFDKALKNLTVGGRLQLGTTLFDGVLSLVKGVGGGATRLYPTASSDVTFYLPPSIGSAGSVLTDVSGNGGLSWVVPPAQAPSTGGVSPGPGRWVNLWPRKFDDDVPTLLQPGWAAATRMVLTTTSMTIAAFVETVYDGVCDIAIGVYDDGQYPNPGALLTSQDYLDVQAGMQCDMTAYLSPGAYWLAVQNIGANLLDMRGTQSVNPYSPGLFMPSNFGREGWNAQMMQNQGASMPPIWATTWGETVDTAGPLYMVQGM